MIDTQQTVQRSDKYVHILVLIVRLNRFTTGEFCSLSLAMCWIPWRYIRVWKFVLKIFFLLSVCRRLELRAFALVNTCPKAVVIAVAFLEWTGTAQANLENTSITVRKYLIPRFAWRYTAYRPGPPAIEHRSPPHRCGS